MKEKEKNRNKQLVSVATFATWAKPLMITAVSIMGGGRKIPKTNINLEINKEINTYKTDSVQVYWGARPVFLTKTAHTSEYFVPQNHRKSN